ncbi:MAG: response regulator transcription factor [Bacteroidales bacterium]|jgi:DNA-binding NarL/FixJ family response regulator|nr:response regulator transcription factor [Bacteroidales bacterium]MCK9449931.1 response regulator transcription factor [Bacteroidales bacterium]MDD3702560.1 response regulator transcription factor [Bacteroidales bacterium]MDY0370619.1 response regulator transcription factor [Bacteroidales bacterium]
MTPLKIYMIDDHKLFIEGIFALLVDEPEIELVGYSLDPQEFLNRFEMLDVDVYLVDINMPKMSGIILAEMIMKRNKKAKILALTMYDDYQHIKKMISKGVLGYILKSANISELVTAVKTVSVGKRFIGSDIQETVMSQMEELQNLEEYSDIKKSRLTKREIEILLLIIRELSNKEIAEKLFISERTVETHRKSILAKTNAKGSLGLYKYAIKHAIVQAHQMTGEENTSN